MSSPSALIKVNYLVMRCLHFGSVRGDLQEDHGCASRCQLPLFPVPIPILSSTKSAFLCAFSLRNPHFRGFRAQNQGFCALLESGTLVFGLFEHKIGVFVRLLWKHWPLETEKRANFLFLRAFDLLFRGYRCCGCLWQAFSPRRCYRRVAAGVLPLERCCRSVAAEALLPKRCRRSVAAGALPPKRYCRSVAAGETAPAGYFTSS